MKGYKIFETIYPVILSLFGLYCISDYYILSNNTGLMSFLVSIFVFIAISNSILTSIIFTITNRISNTNIFNDIIIQDKYLKIYEDYKNSPILIEINYYLYKLIQLVTYFVLFYYSYIHQYYGWTFIFVVTIILTPLNSYLRIKNRKRMITVFEKINEQK